MEPIKEKTIVVNKEELTRDTIEYTFVVPKGEVFTEDGSEDGTTVPQEAQAPAQETEEAAPDEAAAVQENPEAEGPSEAEKDTEAEGQAGQEAPAGTEEADQDPGRMTRYGLPLDHPGMGELAQKQEARRRYKESKKRRFRTGFYVTVTSLIILVGGFIFSVSGFFTCDSIEVKGNSHYTAEEIINMSHASPGRNIIYKSNKQETVDYLMQNPYIKSAAVSRKLPSTLVISVRERSERLAFRYDDDYLIMDEEGILLKKTRNAPKTTLVEGIVVSKIKLGEKIGTEDGRRMDKVLDLIKTMIKSDLYFVKADMTDEKKVKAYIYDNLVVKTDYDTLMENMENGRLHRVVEKLFADGIERGTITFEEDGSASFMPMI